MKKFLNNPIAHFKRIIVSSLLFIPLMLLAQQSFIPLHIPLSDDSNRSSDFSPDPFIIQSHLKKILPELQNTPSELTFVNSIQSPGAWHVSFRQVYSNIPIHGSMLKVTVDKRGVMRSCMNHLLDIPPQKEVSFPASHNTIVKNLSTYYKIPPEKFKPIFWLNRNQLIPAYTAYIDPQDGSAPWIGIFEAKTASVLSKEDAGMYTHSFASSKFNPSTQANFQINHIKKDTSGRARLFVPNPCTRANVSYGDLFVDNEDQHSPIFDQFTDTVLLSPITFDNGTFFLENEYVKLTDLAKFNDTIATSKDGDFFFTRDQSGFEDVMAFYHINQFVKYVQNLGFGSLPPRPVYVDPHGFSDRDESLYTTVNDSAILRFGDGGVDDAEDADVIIHEYCHALSYSASPETFVGLERRGLDEGTADYFASRYSEELSPFMWERIFNWDGHNEFWDGRIVTSPEKYPPSIPAEKVYGTVWASTLINIKEAIGKDITDQLVLQELYANTIGMSLADGARLLLEADSLLFDGIHTSEINFWFCDREIISGPSCLSVSVEEDFSASEHWNLFPNPSQNQVVIRRPTKWQPPSLRIEVTDMMGKLIHYQTWNDGTSEKELSHYPSTGMYLIQVYENNELVYRTKWIKQ